MSFDASLLLSLLATVALLAGLRLMARARRTEGATGLAGLRVREADVEGGRPVRPLRSTTYGVVGRPDFIVVEAGARIPVEVKPTRRASRPYEGDLLQLSAYCLLVEEESSRPPPYGILIYAQQRWEVPWTPGRRQRLLEALAQVRDARNAADVPRSHDESARCRGCGFREDCGQALGT